MMKFISPLSLILLCPCALAAQKQSVKLLDFSDVGVYGTLFDFCDFSVYKLVYFGKSAKPERLEGFRNVLHEAAEKGKRNLVGLYTFDRVSHSRPISEYLANTDAVLRALDLNEVYAVFLSEENVTWNNGLKVLNTLYTHIKEMYPNLPVYQWLTAPDVPHPKLRADGWVFDLYRASRPDFRRKLIKYLITGKPLVMCINASPDVASFEEPQGFASSQGEVDICREFNAPMFFYCVDPKWGSPSNWLDWDTADIVPWRKWLLGVVNECHRTDTSTLPQPSAQYSTGKPIEGAGDEANRYEFVDNFGALQFVDDATIQGLLNLRWDGEREGLYFERQAGEMDSVELQYHFFSEFEMSGIEASLTGQAFAPIEAPVRLALSMTGYSWLHEAVAPASEGEQPHDFKLTASAARDADFKGKEFWVRITGKVPAGEPGVAYSRLDALRVTCHVAPPERREVVLTPDGEGKVLYRDDFTSQKYFHLAHITNKEKLTWQRGHLGTHGVAGGGNLVILRWRFVCEQPLAGLQVRLSCWANERNLASVNTLAVSLDGVNKLVEETTQGKETDHHGNYRGALTLDLSKDGRFTNTREFWVHAEMDSNSGAQTSTSNRLEALEVEAKVQRQNE